MEWIWSEYGMNMEWMNMEWMNEEDEFSKAYVTLTRSTSCQKKFDDDLKRVTLHDKAI